MIINTTIARPYAKAVFDLALRTEQFSEWDELLKKLAIAAIECKKLKVINNPKITLEEKTELFSVITKKFPAAANLVKLLIKQKKLELLPTIATVYEKLLAAHNKILEVTVVSAYDLSRSQKKLLTKALTDRYQQEISLQCHIDTKLIGGAVIYILDKVIDCSVKGILQHLKHNLLFKEGTC